MQPEERRRGIDMETWFSGNVLPRRWAERFREYWRKHEPLRALLGAVLFIEMTGLKRPSMDAMDWLEARATSLKKLSSNSALCGDEKVLDIQLLLYVSRQEIRPEFQSLLFAEEFQKRPEIIGPFVDMYGSDRDLSFIERFRLLILARHTDLDDTGEKILVSLRPNSLPTRLKRYECEHCSAFHGIGSYQEVFDVLIGHNPSLALRTMRATRPRNVHRDIDEKHPDRRSLLNKIHSLLGRDQIADQLANDAQQT